MKWIGQHIWDFYSRFRSDVYLEDLTSTSEANILVVDSDGLISKTTPADIGVGGDLTAIVAGTGLSGSSLSGPIPTLNVDASIPEITTLAGLTSLGANGATTNIVAGDLTMYNPVNDGNPTISLGSSANNRLEIEAKYNDGSGGTTHQHLDEVNFTTYTQSGSTNDGRFKFYVDETLKFNVHDSGVSVYGNVTATAEDPYLIAADSATSSTTQGGKLQLQSDDGDPMGDTHRLGVIEFKGAEDDANTRTIGATIEAFADAAWSDTVNDGKLVFSTNDGDDSLNTALTLRSDLSARFAGSISVATTTTLSGGLTFDSVALTATQTSAESFADNDTSLMTSAAIDDRILSYGYSTTTGDITGVTLLTDDAETISDTAGSADFTIAGGEGIDTTSADSTVTISGEDASTTNKGIVELATTAETNTGTDTGRVVTPAGLTAWTGDTALVTVGTIGTGVWNATKILSPKTTHVLHYPFRGYCLGISSGNFQYAEDPGDPHYPFQLNTDYGDTVIADGSLDDLSTWFRSSGVVMPRACTAIDLVGWASCPGTGEVTISLCKITPGRDATAAEVPIVVATTTFTALNSNDKIEDFSVGDSGGDGAVTIVTSAIAAGDILMPFVLSPDTKTTYFNMTLEVEG